MDSVSAQALNRALGERPREVFRHLVEAFLASGEPVGSRTLSQRLPLALSPASIRNVMADLELMGLLYAPHTSAGRAPTEKGLRLFVDGLLEIGELAPDERVAIEARMSGSGACVYAEFSDESAAHAAHAQLPPPMRGFVVRGLEGHPLHDLTE